MIDISEAHDWIRSRIKKNQGNHNSPEDIDNAINAASADLFNQQVKLMRTSGVMPEILDSFKIRSTGATSSGLLSLSTGRDYELISAAAVIDSVEYPARITKNDEEWVRRRYEDMEMDPLDNNPLHHYKQEQTYALTVASAALQDLPADFIRHIQLFYKDAQNNLKEGEILSDREVAERLESKILAPDTDNPIARIVGDQIEFWPKPPSGSTYNFVLSFYKYPVAERPLVRTYVSDGANTFNLVFHPDPGNAVAYILSYPVKGEYGYTSAGGVITYQAGSSTHLDWDYKALTPLLTRAMFYLGFSIKDPDTVGMPIAKNEIEASQDQITAIQ